MIVTISGKAGSGKSTIAKELAKELNYTHYSSGDFQRVLAKERGLSIEEWGELQKTDKKYDLMVDKRMEDFGKNNDNIVIDGWLSAKFIPKGFKIFLDVDINVAIKRRIKQKRDTESFDNIDDAKKSLINRSETNRERWIKFYDFDFLDMNNYDLVIDTTKMNVKEILDKILKEIKKLILIN